MANVGKYELIEEIGSGSMGVVYLAQDKILERPVALKTVRTGLNVDPEIRERFFREAKTCAKLAHPNIVTVYDLGEDQGTAFIAMEVLKGRDFRQHIQQKTQLPLTVKLDAMVQVCQALAHAHSEGIIHRDIKPSNLFLDNRRHTKVLDFGIARLPSSKLTVMGRVLGTPNYMAPEQILNHKPDGRADLFGAAVVFFELLVYVHPFQSSLIPRRIVDSEPDSIFDHDSNLPIPLDKIFGRAFQKNPEDRYLSAEEIAADLQAVLDDLRMNGSQSCSHLSLPSANEMTIIPLQRQAPIFNAAADGEEPEEWRLSEFLRLLPEFESAVDSNSLATAVGILDALRGIESVDSRFTESIKLCESRLSGAASQAATSNGGSLKTAAGIKHKTMPVLEAEVKPGQSDVASNATEAICRPLQSGSSPCDYCGFINRLSAAFCAECGRKVQEPRVFPINAGKRMDGLNTLAVPGPKESGKEVIRLPETNPVNTSVFTAPHSLDQPTVLDSIVAPAAHISASRIKLLILAAAVLCTLLICLVILLLQRKKHFETPYVATAFVIAKNANIYNAPNLLTQSMGSLANGTLLHILQLPQSGEDPWFLVEPIAGGKSTERGYVNRNDLGEFDAADPDHATRLAEDLAPRSNPSDDDLARQIRTYTIIGARFKGTTTERDAAIQLAGHALALARNLQSEGRPTGDWKYWLQRARSALSALSNDPAAARSISDLDDMEAAASLQPRAGHHR